MDHGWRIDLGQRTVNPAERCSAECLLVAQSRHGDRTQQCPLSGVKRVWLAIIVGVVSSPSSGSILLAKRPTSSTGHVRGLAIHPRRRDRRARSCVTTARRLVNASAAGSNGDLCRRCFRRPHADTLHLLAAERRPMAMTRGDDVEIGHRRHLQATDPDQLGVADTRMESQRALAASAKSL